MEIKLALIALVAFLSVQDLTEARYVHAERGYYIKQFQNTVEEFQNVVSGSISGALANMQGFVDKIFSNDINDLDAKAMDEMLTEIAKRGNDRDCLKAQQENIVDIVSKTNEQLVDCNVEGIDKIYEKFEKTLKASIYTLEVLKRKLCECRDFGCLGDYINIVVKVAYYTYVKSIVLLADYIRLIENSMPEVSQCAIPILESFKAGTQIIKENFEKCIQE